MTRRKILMLAAATMMFTAAYGQTGLRLESVEGRNDFASLNMVAAANVERSLRWCSLWNGVGWTLIVLSVPTGYACYGIIGWANLESGNKKGINDFNDALAFVPAMLMAGGGITLVVTSNKKRKKLELGLANVSPPVSFGPMDRAAPCLAIRIGL